MPPGGRERLRPGTPQCHPAVPGHRPGGYGALGVGGMLELRQQPGYGAPTARGVVSRGQAHRHLAKAAVLVLRIAAVVDRGPRHPWSTDWAAGLGRRRGPGQGREAAGCSGIVGDGTSEGETRCQVREGRPGRAVRLAHAIGTQAGTQHVRPQEFRVWRLWIAFRVDSRRVVVTVARIRIGSLCLWRRVLLRVSIQQLRIVPH